MEAAGQSPSGWTGPTGRSRAGESAHITSIRGVSAGPALALVFPKERLSGHPALRKKIGTWKPILDVVAGPRLATGTPGQGGGAGQVCKLRQAQGGHQS